MASTTSACNLPAVPAVETPPHPASKRKKNGFWRKLGGGSLSLSIIVHAALLGLAAFWIIRIIPPETESVVDFMPSTARGGGGSAEQSKTEQLHKSTAMRTDMPRVAALNAQTDFTMPDIDDLSEMSSLNSLGGADSLGGGLGGLGSGKGLGKGTGDGKGMGTGGLGAGGNGMAGVPGNGSFGFFGIESNGQRVLLMFDVSRSVVNKAATAGVPFTRIKEETIALIKKLPGGARFNVIQFVRNYKPFRPELILANPNNIDVAVTWTETEWQESGQMPASGKGVITKTPNGIVAVLEAAYAMKPDVMFLISDGSFQQTGAAQENVPHQDIERKIRESQALTGKIPIHFLTFGIKEADEDFLKRMARVTGGSCKPLKDETPRKPQAPRSLLPPKSGEETESAAEEEE